MVESVDASGWIVSDSEILGGHPIIRGTRLLASTVRKRIDAGDTFEMLERERLDIDPAALRAAYEFATKQERQRQALTQTAEGHEETDGGGS